MKTFPAIALIELSNIADGLVVADRMLKQSPIAMLKAGTLSGGKYLILIGGSVAAVDEAYKTGMHIAESSCIDHILIPDVHPELYQAIIADCPKPSRESLVTIETTSLATIVAIADASLKSTHIQLVDLRLADNYAGKAYVIYNGAIEEVQDALDISRTILDERGVGGHSSIIPLLADDLSTHLAGSLRFTDSTTIHPEDGEGDVTG